jgi:CubicO group peptidase (beta-lactamase class C family)
MKNTIRFILIALAIQGYSLNAQQESNVQKLDAMIVEGMKDWKVPGLATVVVKDGRVVFQKTYGVKNVQTNEPVNENTLFAMASTTKAIVALSLGMLVDEGKLKWGDKVVEHLPDFRLSDPYITENARVKDLLTHNLGIGNADMLWFIDSTSTRQTLKNFQNAKKAYPLRGGFIYQNIMYVAAGEVIGAASGMHWTDFVKERVLIPLEMNRTQVKARDILKAGNYVTPYNYDPEEGIVKVPHSFADQIGAAGMIWSSPKDISKYLTFLVNDGVYKNDTLVKPKTFHQLFKPHVLQPDGGMYPTTALTKPNWNTYGLGWFQQDYRGTKLDFHTGSLGGLVAIAGVVHDKNMAVYVFANLDHAELRHAIMLKAIDLFAFNDDGRDWHTEVFELYSGINKKELEKEKKKVDNRVKNTKPTLPISAYTGKYYNKMLGAAVVTQMGDALKVNFNSYASYQASHWHYDTFVTNKDPSWGGEFEIRFDLNNQGEVKQLDFMGELFIKKE